MANSASMNEVPQPDSRVLGIQMKKELFQV
jgi:hypothetical protein